MQSNTSAGGAPPRLRIFTNLLAALLLILAAWFLIGGIQLIAAGGSWYYVLAGIALLVSGIQLWRLKTAGALWFGGLYLATVLWTAWESGLDYWGWVPRLSLLTVLGLFLSLLLPGLDKRTPRRVALGFTGLSVAVFALAFVLAFLPHGVVLPEGDAPSAPVVSQAFTTTDAAKGDWVAYGRDKSATRFTPLNQITPENVGQLKRAWVTRTGDLPPADKTDKWAAETTPLKVGNAIFMCTATNSMIRLDPGTGKEVWRYVSDVRYEDVGYTASCRGVSYYTSSVIPEGQACHNRVIEGTLNMKLIAVDAETGKPCSGFGENGRVDLMIGMGKSVHGMVAMTSPPPIVNGVIVTNQMVTDGQRRWAPSGVIRGFDAETGAFKWAWDVKRPNDHGLPPPGETFSKGTPNSWGPMTGDDKLGMVYVPTGNAAVDYFTGMRSKEDDAVGSSVVALDAQTGEQRWVFQTVYRDAWDYDIGSQPTLMDYPGADGKTTPAILVSTKRGQVFLLDRTNGKPLSKVEDRPAFAGDVEGDPRSPVQPWSTELPRFMAPALTEQTMWGLTPLDQLYCRITFRRHRYQGEFTPPSAKSPWIVFPGYNGGTDWGSVAYDPDTGILVGNWNAVAMIESLIPRAEADKMGLKSMDDPEYKPGGGGAEGNGAQAETPYAIAVAPLMVPFTKVLCNEPPYGKITAVNMHTKKVLWERPIGTARANGPFNLATGLPLEMGTPNNGGPMITGGGLVFVGAATDNLLRAINLKTGKVVWTDVLPAGGQASPMSYEYQGHQYVLIMAGGHHYMGTPTGDYVVAYRLDN
jgi:quinoprotein glucose dehydrogenase